MAKRQRRSASGERRKRLACVVDRDTLTQIQSFLQAPAPSSAGTSVAREIAKGDSGVRGVTPLSGAAAAVDTDEVESDPSLLLPYLPRAVIAYHSASSHPQPEPSCACYSFQGAILFADVSGFTALNERMLRENKGSAAAFEHVSTHLNAYFSRLIDECSAHGGDVIKFAGDALIVLFSAAHSSLELATKRATVCATEIQRKHGKYDSEAFSLTLHIGVACSLLHAIHVGGVDHHWEYLVIGDCFSQLESAVDAGKSGDVVLSEPAYRCCKSLVKCKALSKKDYLVTSIVGELPPRQPLSCDKPSPTATAALRSYLSKGLLCRLDSGHTDWIGELRQVTVLFVNLKLKLQESSKGKLDHMPVHRALRAMQTAIFRYEGMIRQILVDDKGTVLIGAFGVPPLSHSDDALRGTRAALMIKEELFKLGTICSVGVTTGNVFCGQVGSEHRCEYAIVGDTVNLSARLMKAAGEGGVLCDHRTYSLSDGRLIFQRLDPIRVKGKSEPVEIYRPHAHTVGNSPAWMPEVACRKDELSILKSKICTETDGHKGTGGVLLIEGERGYGKSLLLDVARALCASEGVACVSAPGMAANIHTPYTPWRCCLLSVLRCDRVRADAQQEKISKEVHALAGASEWLPYLSLLNPVMGLSFPESGESLRLSSNGRMRGAHLLIVTLLKKWFAERNFVICMDNVHHFDEQSWTLLQLIHTSVPQLPIIATSLPLGSSNAFAHLGAATARKPVGSLVLAPFSEREIDELLQMSLGVDGVDRSLLALLQRLCLGCPSFVLDCAMVLIELGCVAEVHQSLAISSMVDSSYLQIIDDSEIDSVLPDSMIAILQAEVDELHPSDQVLLKVCSAVAVVEQKISLDCVALVMSAINKRTSPSDVEKRLLGITGSSKILNRARSVFSFPNHICLHACYGLCLGRQRREIHKACFEHHNERGEGKHARMHKMVAEGEVDLRREPVKSRLHVRREEDGKAALICDNVDIMTRGDELEGSAHGQPLVTRKKSGSFLKKLKSGLSSAVSRSKESFAECTLCGKRIVLGKMSHEGKACHRKCVKLHEQRQQEGGESGAIASVGALSATHAAHNTKRKSWFAHLSSGSIAGGGERGGVGGRSVLQQAVEWIFVILVLVAWLYVGACAMEQERSGRTSNAASLSFSSLWSLLPSTS
eukprot:TRINITY_DN4269_c0_g1_i7.p1 TRINITY_DN4269_c0_g1~~TRINITY_DN4269_c0_g1_i7.p1  ORF type:complete len:1194 (-),score=265.90 TRINITY_DN4269_c0_g1_i7:206-3700(-)